jgi:hypothetical protein
MVSALNPSCCNHEIFLRARILHAFRRFCPARAVIHPRGKTDMVDGVATIGFQHWPASDRDWTVIIPFHNESSPN